MLVYSNANLVHQSEPELVYFSQVFALLMRSLAKVALGNPTRYRL